MSKTCEHIALCRASEVKPGCARRVEAGSLTLAVFNVGGSYFVTDDACTHGPGSLSEGCVDGDVVECDFHNGAFNVRTGEAVRAPCMIPVRTYPVTVDDDGVVNITV